MKSEDAQGLGTIQKKSKTSFNFEIEGGFYLKQMI